jgi:hypothetical protein
MPTVRVHDTAGQEFNEEPVVELDAEAEPEPWAAPEEQPASTPEPGFSSDSDDPLEVLRAAGRNRQVAVSALEVADRALAVAIVAADKAGVPRRAMSRETGVTRQTVYNILAREAK